MKSSSIMTVLALGAAVWAVSCQKHQEMEAEPASAGPRTFTCVIADSDTRLAISEAGKTTWEAGDEILVHGEGSSNRKVVTLTADDISADGKTATITVEGVTPYDRFSDKGYTSTYYACYPASASVSGNLYYYARFAETNLPLMDAYNVGDTFVFYNLCGVISFRVSGDFDSYEFVGNGGETVGYTHYQVQLAATEGDPVLNFHKSSDPGTSGPLKSVSAPVVADGTTVNRIYLPNGTNFSQGFTFKFKKDGVITQTATTSTAVDVARNKFLSLGDITSRLETYTPPETSDHKSEIPISGAINLGADGTANSYIITAPGIYKLPAVKGNSAESVGNVFGAELLWETYNSAETVTENSVVAAVDFENNWLYIQMPETLVPGNALIAAKDVNGQIIWSWHLWIPSTAVTVWDSEAFCGAKMMDRNLGALVATGATGDVDPLSIGLYYQWGRKDPFPGATAFDKSPAGAKVAGTEWTHHKDLITTAYSIAHPTEYASVPEVDEGVWNTDDPQDLWNTEDNKKTIYDPCPPGYRVPLYDSSLPMWKGSDDGFVYDGSRVSYGDFTFTVAGYIDCWAAGYAYSNLRTHIWASKWYDDKRSTCAYFRLDKDQKYYSQKFHKAKAGSVRCVVDGTSEPSGPTGPAEDLSKGGAANSYIVTSAGDYQFKAVKGNSGEAVAPASVEVLWETWNNTEEVTPNSVIASVKLDGNYVVFSTPKTLKPGNAVIAAKDAGGVILWSWHIWVPATAIQDISNGIYSAPMMDRNLGALVVATASDAIPVESFGLTYQWGRKDPFVGAGFMGEESSNATVAGVAVSVTEGDGAADESKITLEQSIQNPTLLGHSQNKDWLIPFDNTLWQNKVKTMYDPCPPGYRVPARDKEQPFHSGDLTAVTGWAEATGWFTLGDPVAVFPFAGYRDDYSPKRVCHAYDRALYWTSYASAEDGSTAYYVNVRKGSAHKLTEAGKSRGGSVRCVRETAE